MIHGARLRLALSLVAALGGHRASAAIAPATPPAARPSVGATVSGTVGFDDNLFLVDSGPLARRESGFATVAARLAWESSPALALAYSPSLSAFFSEHGEDHAKHLLSATSKGARETLSWNAASEFAYVDGDDHGVDYGAGCGSAFSTAAPRERREQWSNQSQLSLRQDGSAGFVRVVGKLQYWDMRTSPVGAPATPSNYVDRYDLSGGLDLGRALLAAGPELYLGYRRGHQFQDRDARPASPRHASNDYDRALLGLDGKLHPLLKVSAQTGWSWHAYSNDPAVYAGLARKDGLFTDITLVWTADPADEVQFKTGQSRTISTTGVNSIALTVHQLSWTHRFGSRWSATLGGKYCQAEYTPAARDDVDYTLSASVACKINASLSTTLAFSRDWGRNNADGIAGPAADLREFDRSLVSLALTWKR